MADWWPSRGNYGYFYPTSYSTSSSSSTIQYVQTVPPASEVKEVKFEPATYFDDSPLAWLDRRVKEVTDLVAA